MSGKCSPTTPAVFCDTSYMSRRCDVEYKCDHNPPACTPSIADGGCCPPAGGAGSEHLHLELAYWEMREQRYMCNSNGDCIDNSHAGIGGRLANCQDACAKPSHGRYACVDGSCVACGDCANVTLEECQSICPGGVSEAGL